MVTDQHTELRATILASPLLRPIIEEWNKLALPDCWLVAGAIAQTVWNQMFNLPPTHGISDIDIVYFDADDLTENGEAQHAARIRAAFSHLPVWIDVKNEARVHTWYEAKFGHQIAPHTSTADAITTFPTTATAVGIRPSGSMAEIYAPFGVDDLLGAVVRANKKQITNEIFDAKVAKWIASWPGLHVIPWES